MGIKRAAQLARLKPEQRSPRIITAALSESITEVRREVQRIINIDLPEIERQEPTFLISRYLLADTIALIEAIEQDGVCMEGIRDGDRSVTLRGKLWHAVWLFFRAAHEDELAEGARYRLAQGVGHRTTGKKLNLIA
jgi:hypothetical protein